MDGGDMHALVGNMELDSSDTATLHMDMLFEMWKNQKYVT